MNLKKKKKIKQIIKKELLRILLYLVWPSYKKTGSATTL